MAAWLLDFAIVGGCVGGLATAGAFAADDAATGILLVLLLGLFAPLYYAFFHAGERGQTLGKRALGISVRNVKTLGRISFGRSLARAYTVALLWAMSWSTVPLILDYLWPLWDAKHQAWHDKVATSVVVRPMRPGSAA